MDTISRENNSMLPMAGVVLGVLALLVGGYAAIKVSSLQKTVADHTEKIQKIDGLESTLGAVSAKADKTASDVGAIVNQTQTGFTQVSNMIGETNARVAKLEEAAVKKAPAAKGKGGKASAEPATAGPGEYLVKKGDSGAKIARALGVSLADLKSVNPDVNWSKLHVDQKIKVPEKKAQ